MRSTCNGSWCGALRTAAALGAPLALAFLNRTLNRTPPTRFLGRYRSLLHFLDAFGDPEAVTPLPTPRPSEERHTPPVWREPDLSAWTNPQHVQGGDSGPGRSPAAEDGPERLAAIMEGNENSGGQGGEGEEAMGSTRVGGWHGAEPVRLSEMLGGEPVWLRCFCGYDAEEPEEISIAAGEVNSG